MHDVAKLSKIINYLQAQVKQQPCPTTGMCTKSVSEVSAVSSRGATYSLSPQYLCVLSAHLQAIASFTAYTEMADTPVVSR